LDRAVFGGPDGVFFTSRPDPSHTQISRIDASDKPSDVKLVDGMILDLVATDKALFYTRPSSGAVLDSDVVKLDLASKAETILDNGKATAPAVDPGSGHVYYGIQQGSSIVVHDATSAANDKVATLDLTGASLSTGPIVSNSKLLWVQYHKPGEKIMSVPLGGGSAKVELDIPSIARNTALLASSKAGVLVGTAAADDNGSYAIAVRTF
jgi:hypothetical protein